MIIEIIVAQYFILIKRALIQTYLWLLLTILFTQ